MEDNFVKVVSELEFKNRILKSFTEFENTYLNKKIVVNSNTSIQNNALAFVNQSFSTNNIDRNIKKIIDNEVYNLELFSNGLGSIMLSWLSMFYRRYPSEIFNLNNDISEKFIQERIREFDSNIYRTKKSDINRYVRNIKDFRVQSIIKCIVNKCDVEDIVYVEKSNQTKDVIRKSDSLFFKIDFDNTFLTNSSWHAKEYNYIIIDGFIDSLSEIHHLLYVASENKEPYVIFCKGMRNEVKETIRVNLMRGTINVMPICLTINEENVNLLNDIAACHNSDIISALKGDVISVEVKRSLSKGKEIKINKEGFYLTVIDKQNKNRHMKYLYKKIESLDQSNPNRKYLEKRIKNLNTKKVTIYLGSDIKESQTKKIDAHLKFLKLVKKGFIKLKSKNNSRDIYSIDEIVILFKKFRSILQTISEAGCSLNLEYKNE